MEEVRKLSSLALALRAEKGVKVRQPLKQLKVQSDKLNEKDKEFLEILKDEVNVKEIVFDLKMEKDVDYDWEITPELKEEGILREVIRAVQGLRHDANYVPKDVICAMLEVGGLMAEALKANEAKFKKEIGAKIIEYKKSDKFDAELNSEINKEKVWIGVRKI